MPTGGALKGGDEVRSRVRVAASTGLVLSGLLIAGVGGALAFAQPDRVGADSGERSSSPAAGGAGSH
jgi:hypothetical protein